MKTVEQEMAEQLNAERLRRTVNADGNITEVYSASAQERVNALRERLLNRQQQSPQNNPMTHAQNMFDSAQRGDVEGIIKAGVQTAIASLQHVMEAVQTNEALSFESVAMRAPRPAPAVTMDLDKLGKGTDAIPDITDMTRRNP